MIVSNVLALGAIAFSTFCAASPLASSELSDFAGLETRRHHCAAVRKNGSPVERRNFEFDEYEEFAEENLLDTRGSNQHCAIMGSIVNPPTPTYQRTRVTIRQCANWCLCRLGYEQCKSFGFDQSDPATGLGTCSSYNVQARQLQYDSSGTGTFYAHHCFRQSNPTRPHPPPMTTAQKRSEPTPIAKRQDTFGDLVANALEGL